MVGLIPLLPSPSIPERMVAARAVRSASGSPASWRRASSPASDSARAGSSPADPGTRTSCSAWSRRSVWASCSARCCPRMRSCRRTGCARCPSATRRAVQARARRPDRRGRLRARRIDLRPVRWELELARAGLVPDQLPDHPVAPELGHVAGRRLPRRVPDRVRHSRSGCATSPRTSPSRLVSIWLPTTRGRRPVFGAYREVPDRPGVARPAAGSTSTSTATPAPASARRTRPAGPASSPT